MALIIQEHVSLKPKTTMKIGGEARYFAELHSTADVYEALQYTKQHNIPLIPLGGGSNTIFADGTIDALVVQVKEESIGFDGDDVIVGAGAYLGTVVADLAERGYDLSALTGIPGTVGGAVFGNAGQGPTGTWIDRFIVSIDCFIDGVLTTLSTRECGFAYRVSAFQHMNPAPLIWSVRFRAEKGDPEIIKKTIADMLKIRHETQLHRHTAGSCFKAYNGTPAWKIIDQAGLRGYAVGGVQIAEKHANFLVNTGGGTFADVTALIAHVRTVTGMPLTVEMRLLGSSEENTDS